MGPSGRGQRSGRAHCRVGHAKKGRLNTIVSTSKGKIMSETNTISEDSPPRPSHWFIFAAVAVVVAVIVVAMLVSATLAAWEKMVRLDCMTNLREISVPCREYAAKHDGHFPSTWGELNFVGDDANWAKLLHCPETGHAVGIWSQVDLWSDYRLLPGRSTNDLPETILALEPLANHKAAGANVLFVDGSTAWWPASRLLGAPVGTGTNNLSK
jgi:prepilin-type processing-associated H-X9-DG protein